MQAILRSVRGRALAMPDRNAILLADRGITYSMLDAGTASAASHISKLGIDRSAPVGVLIDNPAWHLIVCLALARVGYASVSLRAGQLSAGPPIVLTAILSDRLLPPSLPESHLVSASWFSEPADNGMQTAQNDTAPDPRRIVRVEFTSGSTGVAKPVGFTAQAVHNQTINRIAVYDLREPLALCMFSVTSNVGFGFALSYLMQGRTLCFADSNDLAIDLIGYHGVGAIAGSPGQLIGLANRAEARGRVLESVRQVIIAGGMLSPDDLTNIRTRIGGNIQIDYGATETGPTAFAAGATLFPSGQAALRLSPFQDIEIRAEPGACGDEFGEVRTRSSGMGWPFTGSMIHSPENEGDGWFHPGDLGVFDCDGCLVLKGRKDDLINAGGHKVSVEVLEAQLRANSDIEEAAVTKVHSDGSADPGLKVHLVLATGADFERVDAWVKARFSFTRRVEVKKADSLPKTESGKIDRQSLLADRRG